MADSIAQLPRPLTGWSILFDLFDDQLAAALEQLIHRLSAGIEFQRESHEWLGEPNGYRGIARRGPLSRLLLSELATIDEFPEEFLRRVTQGEAGYYEIATLERTAAGRFVVLFDAGPDQLGAARIGHLATMLLLWRRAQRLGATLEVGTLQNPDETRSGELRDLVVWWLQSRTADAGRADDLTGMVAEGTDDDDLWVCCSAHAASHWTFPAGVEVVSFDEAGDGPDGATDLEVRHRTRHARVPLPERDDAVRLLRGRGFRRERKPRTHTPTALRHPSFPGARSFLLCRAEEPDVLVSIAVPDSDHAERGRPKHRAFSGPVIAAAFIGTRTVAVTYVDRQLVVEVVGKHLADVGGVSVSLADVEMRESELDLIGAKPFRTLVFERESLCVDLPSGWWRIARDQPPKRLVVVAAAPSSKSDDPILVHALGNKLHCFSREGNVVAPLDSPIVIGAGCIGWFEDGAWKLAELSSGVMTYPERRHTENVRIAGIVSIEGHPSFVGLSSAGQIIRLLGAMPRTLTRISGDVLHAAVHPLKPLIAVQHHDSSISVFDLAKETIVLRTGNEDE